MGLRDLFKGRQHAAPAATPGAAPGPTMTIGRTVECVGESHYLDAFARIVGDGQLPINTLATLQPEPTNPYDAQAVAVVIDGHKCGHLAKAEARGFRRQIDKTIRSHGSAVVLARIVGGTGRYGVYLEPADVLPFGRQAIEGALYQGGYVNYDEDSEGFGISHESNGSFTVWNGGDDDVVASEMAKMLRECGFAARVHTRTGGSKAVRVTGWG